MKGAVAGSGLASDDILFGPLSMFKFADASAGASKQSIYRSSTQGHNRALYNSSDTT